MRMKDWLSGRFVCLITESSVHLQSSDVNWSGKRGETKDILVVEKAAMDSGCLRGGGGKHTKGTSWMQWGTQKVMIHSTLEGTSSRFLHWNLLYHVLSTTGASKRANPLCLFGHWGTLGGRVPEWVGERKEVKLVVLGKHQSPANPTEWNQNLRLNCFRLQNSTEGN